MSREPPGAEPFLRLEDLRVRRSGRSGRGDVEAVRGVSLEVARGTTMALVGRSGAGKSSLALAVAGIVPHEGRVLVEGREVGTLLSGDARGFRRRIQLLLQNPAAALDPRIRIGDSIDAVLRLHGRTESVEGLLGAVGLDRLDPRRLPHQISGGEAQRVCLARALAVGPELLILDEPTASLDASTRLEIVRLLRELQHFRGLTYLYMAHDLDLVRAVADEVAVLDEGRIVERGETSRVFQGATHHRTRELLAARPTWSGEPPRMGGGV